MSSKYLQKAQEHVLLKSVPCISPATFVGRFKTSVRFTDKRPTDKRTRPARVVLLTEISNPHVPAQKATELNAPPPETYEPHLKPY